MYDGGVGLAARPLPRVDGYFEGDFVMGYCVGILWVLCKYG